MFNSYHVKRNVRKLRNADTHTVEIEGELFGVVNGKDSCWRAQRLDTDKRTIDPVLWGVMFKVGLLTEGWFLTKDSAVDFLVKVWQYFDAEPKLLRYAKEELEERKKKVSELEKHVMLIETLRTHYMSFGADLIATISHTGAVQPSVKYTIKSRGCKLETTDLQEALDIFLEIGLPLSVLPEGESDED